MLNVVHSQAAFAQNSLTAMRLGTVQIDGQTALRLVVETADPQPAKMLLLSDPWRLVLDYRQMEWAVEGFAGCGTAGSTASNCLSFWTPAAKFWTAGDRIRPGPPRLNARLRCRQRARAIAW